MGDKQKAQAFFDALVGGLEYGEPFRAITGRTSDDPQPKAGLSPTKIWVHYADGRGSVAVSNTLGYNSSGIHVAVAENLRTKELELRKPLYAENEAAFGGGAGVTLPATGSSGMVAEKIIPGMAFPLMDANGNPTDTVQFTRYLVPGHAIIAPQLVIEFPPTSGKAWLAVAAIDKNGIPVLYKTDEMAQGYTFTLQDVETVQRTYPDSQLATAYEVWNGDTTVSVTNDKRKVFAASQLRTGHQKNNFSATTAPTVDDDITQGYSVWSIWINTSTGDAFYCADTTVGAAVWVQLNGGGGGTTDYILLRDEKASGTNGGTATSGAWQKRTLNTEVVDTGGHCTLASDEFTLLAGTYRYEFSAPAYFCGLHQARLYNVTAGAVVTDGYGTSEYSATTNGDVTRSIGKGRFTIGSSTVFRLEHQVGATVMTNGWGGATSFGGTEVYSIIELEREP